MMAPTAATCEPGMVVLPDLLLTLAAVRRPYPDSADHGALNRMVEAGDVSA